MKRKFLTALLSFALVFSLALSLAVTAGQAAAPAEPETQTVNFTNAAPLVESPSLPNPANADGATAAGEDEHLHLNKKVEPDPNKDGEYIITLDALSTGAITTVTASGPADIVLVIDLSGSMKWTAKTQMPVYDDPNDPLDSQLYDYYGSNGKLLHRSGDNWVDTSGDVHVPKTSPDDPNGEQFYTSRICATKKALRAFIAEVENSAKGANGTFGDDDDVHHKIALVSFANKDGTSFPWQNTGIWLSGTEITNYPGVKSRYGEAFKDVTDEQNRNNIGFAVNNFEPNGSTFSQYGLEMANGIFNANPIPTGETRKRVVIFFTDGIPGSGSNDGAWGNGEYDDYKSSCYHTANDAISQAHTLKNNHHATVYSVGIFIGADGSDPANIPDYINNENAAEDEQHKNANRYMHLVSSNYPNATSMTNPGSFSQPPNGTGYYLSAADAGALTAIFEEISGEITSGTSAGEETVVRDIISPYFDIPSDAATDGSVALYTQDAKNADTYGNLNDPSSWKDRVPFQGGITVTNTADGAPQVEITGFDFSKNFVSEDAHSDPFDSSNTNFYGRKLVIEIKGVKPKAGFLGGNNVSTNDGASGVYDPEKPDDPLRLFTQPTVDVPIPEITVTAQDKNVYLYGDLSKTNLLEGAAAAAGTISINLSAENYGLEPWQYEFVNIAVNVTEESYTDLTEDTDYTVEVKITPKNNGEVTEQSKSVTANINVFKPEVTFKDAKVSKGGVINLNDEYVKTEWKHGDTLASNVTMIGDAPVLAFTYTVQTTPPSSEISGTPANYTVDFDKDTYVKVTAKIDGHELTVTGDQPQMIFQHENCTIVDSCPLNDLTNTNNAKGQFILHILECTLTVKKQGANGTTFTPGESFIFTITKENDATFKPIKIVLYANENGNVAPVKIVGLAPGTYIVTEDSGWSWRFELESITCTPSGSAENGVTLNGGDDGTATAVNKRTNNKWLSWDTCDVNNWNGNGIEHVQIPDADQSAQNAAPKQPAPRIASNHHGQLRLGQPMPEPQ